MPGTSKVPGIWRVSTHRPSPADKFKRHMVPRVILKGMEYRPLVGVVTDLADDQHRGQGIVGYIDDELAFLGDIGPQFGDMVFDALAVSSG